MLDDDPTPDTAPESVPESAPEPPAQPVKRATRTRRTTTLTPSADAETGEAPEAAPAKKTAKKAAAKRTTKAAAATTTKKTAAKRTTKKAAAEAAGAPDAPEAPAPEVDAPTADETSATDAPAAPVPLFQAPPPPRKRATKKAAAPAAAEDDAPVEAAEAAPAKKAAKKSTRKTAAKKAAPAEVTEVSEGAEPADKPAKKKSAAKKKAAKKAEPAPEVEAADETEETVETDETGAAGTAPDQPATSGTPDGESTDGETPDDESTDDESQDEQQDGSGNRRRRRRGGRRRGRRSGEDDADAPDGPDAPDGTDAPDGSDGSEARDGSEGDQDDDSGDEGGSSSSRRRRRRRRSGSGGGDGGGNGAPARRPEDEITSVSGSTRLEAKKQRRREGREAGRRRAPIVSEAEFLARREAVDRVMVVRQRDDLTQIAVLEDDVLVEHYVARESQTSMIGNVYLGRVQNVLPSMEAAFVDIGKGRNAVLYAGEVNWQALGHRDGQPRKIESVLSSGQTILVQVTKDPVGHKGARLTGQISLPGRFLVYVPEGSTSGISRKLPDTERNRLKTLLKQIVPEGAGVIVRTAAEGASEEELTLDVERLTARWQDISSKAATGKGPNLLYGEPDLTLKVVRDLFTEDFGRLVIEGDDAWNLVDEYVAHMAPELRDRLHRHEVAEDGPDAGKDVFAAHRIDEQIAKGLDRKVWLPSGGSLIIDRTEAMTVVDVNTGKFTGSGGNLEETVTKNNLEAAEEMVRQLRLRDIGGIIVIDFIDMVLESNRDLVLRRLVECLGRDRTRHQVAEVTSLGLVQMTRKRIGTGLLEAFSDECTHCKGRGLILHDHPIEPSSGSRSDDDGGNRGRGRGGRGGRSGRGGNGGGNDSSSSSSAQQPSRPVSPPSPADLAHSRPPEPVEDAPVEDAPVEDAPVEQTAAAEPAVDTAPRVVTSTRRRRAGRPAGQPVAQAAPTLEPTPEPEPEPSPEPATEPAPVDTAPRVVTSTRRRRAARPAGQPTVQAEPTPQPETQPETQPGTQPETASAPVESAPVRVVTSTRRRRGAGRPAGPPSDVPSEATEPAPEDLAPQVDEAEVEEADEVGHVPVKRKGSRRR